MNNQEQYGADLQQILVSYMLVDPSSFSLSQNILRAEYFDDRLRSAVEFILDYSAKYRAVPNRLQVKAASGVDLPEFPSTTSADRDWYLHDIEGFCRYKALELAVLDGIELIQKGKGGEIEKRVRDALTISLMSDLGTTYFENPIERLERMRDRSNFEPTGWKVLDEKLYGGFTRGSLNVFAGGSGSGKSLFLQNLALNYAFEGRNVVYITLELSEELVAMRLDAMVAGVGTKEIMRNISEVGLTVKFKGKHAGDLKIKKLPEAGTTSNDLRAYIKQYEIETGRRIDVLVVDYLDLMHPNDRSIKASDLFVKDKYVSEELRAIGSDLQCIVITGSQLNRSSVEAQEFDHSHIAGGISKINTADNVFGIYTSTSMRERGEYEIQFLKTRSSSAVGQKIKLSFNPICMRITDPENAEEAIRARTAEEIQAEIKERTRIAQQANTPAPETSEPAASPMRDRLKSLLEQTRTIQKQ